MERFEDIIVEHSYLLYQKGYLNDNDKQGSFTERFEKAFRTAIHGTEKDNKQQSFFLETNGQFNDNMDRVYFKFHYQYDPGTEQLNLKSLAIKLDEVQKILFLSKNRDLPPASKVYDALAHEKKTKIAKTILNIKQTGKGRRL